MFPWKPDFRAALQNLQTFKRMWNTSHVALPCPRNAVRRRMEVQPSSFSFIQPSPTSLCCRPPSDYSPAVHQRLINSLDTHPILKDSKVKIMWTWRFGWSPFAVTFFQSTPSPDKRRGQIQSVISNELQSPKHPQFGDCLYCFLSFHGFSFWQIIEL